ncbi:S8 family peptidase (plasmid) [Bacillus thuringiensis]|nr:S8 family peptidase [Bacillus thuringiensis]
MKQLLSATDFKILKQLENINEVPQGVLQINAPKIWSDTSEGEGRTIAIIDSGCQIDHPDISPNIVDYYNFSDEDSYNVTDYTGHGTHIAGIIAATRNIQGVVGVAPKAKLLILKVTNQHGQTSYNNLIQAIKFSIDWRGEKGEKVDVINLSLGGRFDNKDLHSIIEKAFKSGIIIVTASGNQGDGNIETVEEMFPGVYKQTIQVGSVDSNSNLSFFTNTNSELEFLAPGENILSTFPGNGYAYLTGTSMAAPHLSGSVALLLNLLKDQKGISKVEAIKKLLLSNSYQYSSSLRILKFN